MKTSSNSFNLQQQQQQRPSSSSSSSSKSRSRRTPAQHSHPHHSANHTLPPLPHKKAPSPPLRRSKSRRAKLPPPPEGAAAPREHGAGPYRVSRSIRAVTVVGGTAEGRSKGPTTVTLLVPPLPRDLPPPPPVAPHPPPLPLPLPLLFFPPLPQPRASPPSSLAKNQRPPLPLQRRQPSTTKRSTRMVVPYRQDGSLASPSRPIRATTTGIQSPIPRRGITRTMRRFRWRRNLPLLLLLLPHLRLRLRLWSSNKWRWSRRSRNDSPCIRIASSSSAPRLRVRSMLALACASYITDTLPCGVTDSSSTVDSRTQPGERRSLKRRPRRASVLRGRRGRSRTSLLVAAM